MRATHTVIVGISLAFVVCFRAFAACPPGFHETFNGCAPDQSERFPPPQPPMTTGNQSPAINAGQDTFINYGPPLVPLRTFLDKNHIPPEGVGAYGILAFRGKPTAATKHRLSMACESFLAYLPRASDVPKSVSLADQMVTIWPIDNPDAPEVAAENCNFLLEHYNTYPADQAMQDARRQKAKFDGDGPFLIGWSPSNARGKPDKLVLVVDMSGYASQDRFDHAFLFWKDRVILDPELWRSGWSLDQVRLAIRDFADHYGADILKAAHLSDSSGEKKISE